MARPLVTFILLVVFVSPTCAQAVKAQPYNGQLRTDPAVGNIQGIQRYGRSLKTDPDEGEGFSYHVYPIQEPPGQALLATDQPGTPRQSPTSEQAVLDLNAARVRANNELGRIFDGLKNTQKDELKGELQTSLQVTIEDVEQLKNKFIYAAKNDQQQIKNFIAAHPDLKIKETVDEWHKALSAKDHHDLSLRQSSLALTASTLNAVPPAYYPGAVSPYPPPFDATAGLRLAPPGISPSLRPTATAFPPVGAVDSASMLTAAVAFDAKTKATINIYHQPLIQVKVRVIEVARSDQLQVTSVLDVIGQPFVHPTLIAGNNVNRDKRDLYSGTRFDLPQNLVTFTGNGSNLGNITGSGFLVNLTTGNLNYIARLLASEFHSDVITAPEVVTLNGQNVEFVSGEKVPFALGQSVIQGNADNIQQFFYKHVGTYVSITPRIVNWGKLAEGSGKAPIIDTDVGNWQEFLTHLQMLVQFKRITELKDFKFSNGMFLDPTIQSCISSGTALPVEIRGQLLDSLSSYSKADLVALGLPVVHNCGCGQGCDWRPQDCTIDLETVVRLSEAGQVALPVAVNAAANAPMGTSETNVRGIANIVQVKSGHGAVIGGLIGEREIKEVNKVPILGDIPLVGFFFRSKSTQRQKTELLIFIEAQVLDPNPDAARAQSYQNFLLGGPFVAGEFLDNPLERGMYRAGFGSYLPPTCPAERIYWERLGRKVRKVCTEIDDKIE